MPLLKQVPVGIKLIMVFMLASAIGDILFIMTWLKTPEAIARGIPYNRASLTMLILIKNTLLFALNFFGAAGLLYSKKWGYICARVSILVMVFGIAQRVFQDEITAGKMVTGDVLFIAGALLVIFFLMKIYLYLRKMQKYFVLKAITEKA